MGRVSLTAVAVIALLTCVIIYQNFHSNSRHYDRCLQLAAQYTGRSSLKHPPKFPPKYEYPESNYTVYRHFNPPSVEVPIPKRPKSPPPKKSWRHGDHVSFVRESDAARRLPRRGQLFCWVMTSTKYHDTRARAINETWIHRCDHGQVFTNDVLPKGMDNVPYSTVFAGLPDEYSLLFYKTFFALHYQYTYISDQFDWYMKADDDTYVVVEHLRDLLDTLDPNKPYYLGMRLKPFLKAGYNSGGAGYVLSREAMRLFNEKLYMNERLCPPGSAEDLQLAKCLRNVGIVPYDTRNDKGQQRFNGYNFVHIYEGTMGKGWYKDGNRFGMNGIGEGLISMHYIDPNQMRFVDQLLYDVRGNLK